MKMEKNQTNNQFMQDKKHEAFILQSTLLEPKVPPAYLKKCQIVLQKFHFEEVFEERTTSFCLCGFPCCGVKVEKRIGAKYKISLSKHQVIDTTKSFQFCSSQCEKLAHQAIANTPSTPSFQRPSLKEVFGTDKPSPLQSVIDCIIDMNLSESTLQEPKQIWTTRRGFGNVIERIPNKKAKDSFASSDPSSIHLGDLIDCPKNIGDTIEGFIYPSSNSNKLKEQDNEVQNPCEGSDEEILLSSENSDEEIDFDCSNPTNYMTHFANIWRILSSWVSNQTKQTASSYNTAANYNVSHPLNTFLEYKMDSRTLPQHFNQNDDMGSNIYHCGEILANQGIIPLNGQWKRIFAEIVKTFEFGSDAPLKSLEWFGISLVVLLVSNGYSKLAPRTTSDPSGANIYGLDIHEINQLLQLFESNYIEDVSL